MVRIFFQLSSSCVYTWYGSDGVAEQRRGGGREQRGIIKIHSVIYTSLCEVERKKSGIFFFSMDTLLHALVDISRLFCQLVVVFLCLSLLCIATLLCHCLVKLVSSFPCGQRQRNPAGILISSFTSHCSLSIVR